MSAHPDIQPISASSHSTIDEDTYRLLNMIHSMAGTMAQKGIGGWRLAETNSSEEYGPITTVWTNGIVDVKAESTRYPEHHVYSMYAARRNEE